MRISERRGRALVQCGHAEAACVLAVDCQLRSRARMESAAASHQSHGHDPLFGWQGCFHLGWPGVPHPWRRAVSDSFRRELWTARALRGATRVPRWNDPSLIARLVRIRAEGERKPPYYREMCGILLTEILYLYLRLDPRGASPDNSTVASCVAAHDHVLQARACGCTDRTLRLHFHHVMHMQPLQVLQRHRIGQGFRPRLI